MLEVITTRKKTNQTSLTITSWCTKKLSLDKNAHEVSAVRATLTHTQNARKHCLQNTLPSAKYTAKPNIVVCYINLSQPTCSAVSSGDAGYPDFQ